MNDQCESPTIEEIQADFIRAVRDGDRVTVSKVNAIGGWDSSHFSTRDIRVAADELDRLRVENERLRQIIVKNWCGDYWRGVTNEHADEINAALQTDGGANDQT